MKKLISLVLAIVMIAGCMSTVAFAEESATVFVSIADKGQLVASQVKTICEINWSDTIKALQLFEGIINDMGVFMKQLIDLGRKQLESVYSHNE